MIGTMHGTNDHLGIHSSTPNHNGQMNGDTNVKMENTHQTLVEEPVAPVTIKIKKDQDSYNLCWNQFADNMGAFFREIKVAGDFIDVTLACEGRQISAHQVVLSAASPFFRQILKNNPCQHPIVILNEVKYKDLSPLLSYMYHGEIHVPRSQVDDVLKTAKYLQIRGLQEKVVDLKETTTNSQYQNDLKEEKSVDQTDNETSKNTATVSSTLSPRSRSPSIEASTSTFPSKNTRDRSDSVSLNRKSSSPKSNDSTHSPPSSPTHKKPKLQLSSSVYEPSVSPATSINPQFLNHPLASALKPSLAGAALSGLPGMHMPPMPLPPSTFSHHSMPPVSAAQAFSQHMSQQMSHHFSQQMSHQLNHPLSHPMTQQISHQFSQQMNQQLSQHLNQQFGQNTHHASPDDASDTCGSDKSEERNNGRGDHENDEEMDTNSLEKMSGLANMAALKGLTGFPGPSGLMGLPTLGSSPHSDSSPGRRPFDFYRVRATDPRPCQLCGKIYKNAHTLRTHMEDKHSNCNGFRCVLCGTVAKSRNSLHSHMSRQHRGISTKDLPLLPMPSPWNPEIASKYIHLVGGVGEVVRQNYRRLDRDNNNTSMDGRNSSLRENGSMSPYMKSEDMKDVRGAGYDSLSRPFDIGSYGAVKPPINQAFIESYLQMMRATGTEFMPPSMLGNRHSSVLDLTRGHSPGNRMDDDENRASDNFSEDESGGGIDDKTQSMRSSAGVVGSRSPPSDENESTKWQ